MRKLKNLALLFLILGCAKQESKKNQQAKNEDFWDIRVNFLKTVNHPFFLSNIDIKTITPENMMFFDDRFMYENGEGKTVKLSKYEVKLTSNRIKCCFTSGYTDLLQVVTTNSNLKISFKNKSLIKFIGYKIYNKEMECYFKISSLNDFVYLTIQKNALNEKYNFVISYYLKVNKKLY